MVKPGKIDGQNNPLSSPFRPLSIMSKTVNNTFPFPSPPPPTTIFFSNFAFSMLAETFTKTLSLVFCNPSFSVTQVIAEFSSFRFLSVVTQYVETVSAT